jgi:hypothetical protein
MPDRIIRDELLTSERYWSVSPQAQQLYIHLLLVVDDAARFSGKNFSIRAACFPGRPIEPLSVEKMLSELSDVDLIRMYESGGDRFLFIPRFNNRRRYVCSSKYPVPPNEINDIHAKKVDSSTPQVRLKDDSGPTQVSPKSGGVGVGEGLERGKPPTAGARGELIHNPGSFAMHLDWRPSPNFSTLARLAGVIVSDNDTQIGEFVAYWLTQPTHRTQAAWDHAYLKTLQASKLRGEADKGEKRKRTMAAWWETDQATLAYGNDLGIQARPGESMQEYRARLKQTSKSPPATAATG